VNNLVRELRRQGHTVVVLTRRYQGTPESEYLNGVQIVRADQPNFSLLGRGLLVINMVREGLRIVREQPPDVIHAQGTRSLITAEILKTLARVPVIATFHGLQRLWRRDEVLVVGRKGIDRFQLIFALTAPLEGLLMRRADLITIQSPLLKKVFSEAYKIPEVKIAVVQNALDVDRFDSAPPIAGSQTILFVGHLGGAYDVELLLRAFQIVLKDVPKAKLMVVGDGPQRGVLSNLARNLGIEGSVTFAGRITDRGALSSCYRSSRVVVVPFNSTGYFLPLSATEAMSSGRPVIATMALEGMEGVFPVSHDSAALARAMTHVLTLEEGEYLKLTRSTRAYVERTCDSRVVADDLLRLYREVSARKVKSQLYQQPAKPPSLSPIP